MDSTNKKRKSVFRQDDELEIMYNELEKKLASKQLYQRLVNNAIAMNLRGEV